jgi:hypothetical protein
MYTLYMTVYLVTPCQKFRIYTIYNWFWPTLYAMCALIGKHDADADAQFHILYRIDSI